MTDLHMIDNESAAALLTTLRRTRWSWTIDDLPRIAADLGWRNIQEVDGVPAAADAPWDLRGGAIHIDTDDKRVDTIRIRVTDLVVRKSPESLSFMHSAWTSLVALATDLVGKPDRRIEGQNPDRQWRGDEATIGIQNAKVAVAVNWANNTFQDHWNSLRAPE
jgi:hypothetical protein